MASSDIFSNPIATGPPPSQIKQRKDHPQPRLGIDSSAPIHTNKFYSNFFLGSQASPTYLHPYSIAWAKGRAATGSWGMAITHVEASQRSFGPPDTTGAAEFYTNPVGLQSICLGATELTSNTVLKIQKASTFSVLVNLLANAQSQPAIQFPLVQCLGLVTAKYNGVHPLIQTGDQFRSVIKVTAQPKPGISKYKLQMMNGHTWILYAQSTKGAPLDLEVVNGGYAHRKSPFTGIIQVGKDPGGAEAIYDKACGAYPTDLVLSGTAQGTRGTYTFTYQKEGLKDQRLAMFALPHHVSSFDAATKQAMTAVKLQTTTKGVATAVLADKWTMVEDRLPISMAFLPWSADKGTMSKLSPFTKAAILKVAQSELNQNVDEQSNLNSMYFSGKALCKFAIIALCARDMLGDQALAEKGLEKLKAAWARWGENRQQFPLVYESAWGGVVSSASYVTGNSGADFGNTYYNDHHFHYGYFVVAAAIIGHMDPSWIPKNKDYVNTLLRDYANPSTQDKYFPAYRAFDWVHGHSWAHGLFESADGKDQESSSEDAMAAYGIKMWGMVTGNQDMAAQGNMMLAVLARSLKNYYLYCTDNTVQPSNFIGNKVAGIMFENKVHHTTFFGKVTEYVQGIHMIPLMPFSKYCRDDRFVDEEWKTYFSNGRVDKVAGGWRGILYGNLATRDPQAAYRFFSAPNFDANWLDGGASRTWYMCYAAALGGL